MKNSFIRALALGMALSFPASIAFAQAAGGDAPATEKAAKKGKKEKKADEGAAAAGAEGGEKPAKKGKKSKAGKAGDEAGKTTP